MMRSLLAPQNGKDEKQRKCGARLWGTRFPEALLGEGSVHTPLLQARCSIEHNFSGTNLFQAFVSLLCLHPREILACVHTCRKCRYKNIHCSIV